MISAPSQARPGANLVHTHGPWRQRGFSLVHMWRFTIESPLFEPSCTFELGQPRCALSRDCPMAPLSEVKAKGRDIYSRYKSEMHFLLTLADTKKVQRF